MEKRAVRILCLNHVSAFGGAERSLRDLIQALPRDRYDREIALPGAGRLVRELEGDRCQVSFVGMRRLKRSHNPVWMALRAIQMIPAVLEVRRLIRERNIAVVHSNSSTAHLYGAVAARLSGVPCVWHCRDMVNLGVVGRWMGRAASRVVAISESVAQHMESTGCAVAGRLTVIHNGIDTDVFCPGERFGEVRRQMGLGSGDLVVAMIAHMTPWKRHDLFIESAARVIRDTPGARFVLAGCDLFAEESAYVQRLHEQASRRLPPGRLTFAGEVDDMVAFLNAVDVVVHPADNEPFGRAVAEAMSMARPVVAINRGGPAELIRDGIDGLLVPPDNCEALADSIGALCKDTGRRMTMGRSARDRIVRDFGIGAFQRKIRQFYQSMESAAANGRDGVGS